MDKFLNQYEILFRKANSDFKAAKILFENFSDNDEEPDADVIYFHLQQCAEKLLKSLLDYNNIKFPKIHDLRELISLFNDNKISCIDDIEILIKLNYYAVEGRYVIINDDLIDIDIYFQILEKLIHFVKDIVH